MIVAVDGHKIVGETDLPELIAQHEPGRHGDAPDHPRRPHPERRREAGRAAAERSLSGPLAPRGRMTNAGSPARAGVGAGERPARRGPARARRSRRPRARSARGRAATSPSRSTSEPRRSWSASWPSGRPTSPSTPRTGASCRRAGTPSWVLVVDPIDGTRPAMAGLEAACVSVAAARLDSEARGRGWATCETGCVVEIKSGRAFVAERGGGLDPAPSLSANRDLSRMFWAYGLRGRPMRAIAEVLGELIDASSVGGGTFDLGSATLRHDPRRHRPARRLRRAGPQDRGGGARECARSSSGWETAWCSTTPPTTWPRRL